MDKEFLSQISEKAVSVGKTVGRAAVSTTKKVGICAKDLIDRGVVKAKEYNESLKAKRAQKAEGSGKAEADEPVVQEPVTVVPTSGEPITQPVHVIQTVPVATPDAPVVEPMVKEEPVVATPVVEAPVVEAPAVEPVAVPPVETPVEEKPVIEEPVATLVVEPAVKEDSLVEYPEVDPVVQEEPAVDAPAVPEKEPYVADPNAPRVPVHTLGGYRTVEDYLYEVEDDTFCKQLTKRMENDLRMILQIMPTCRRDVDDLIEDAVEIRVFENVLIIDALHQLKEANDAFARGEDVEVTVTNRYFWVAAVFSLEEQDEDFFN